MDKFRFKCHSISILCAMTMLANKLTIVRQRQKATEERGVSYVYIFLYLLYEIQDRRIL